MIDVTIAIPTFNGEEYLDELLKAVFNQSTSKKYEVLIIDSGSADKTLDIIANYPKVRLHKIPNKDFGHGKTRNLAMEMASGQHVIYLTQDAVPATENWLDAMIEPFGIDKKIGCVFGKQIPRPDCFVTLKREIVAVFDSLSPEGKTVIHKKTPDQQPNTFFSDVNSAISKQAAKKVPFRDVNYAEDQALGIDMLDAGLYKAYTPAGAVYHSHDYPLKKYFKRKFDEYVGLRKTTGYTATAGIKELVFGSAKATLQDYAFILHDMDYSFFRKIHDILLSPFYNLSLRLAIRAAGNKKVTAKLHDKISLEAGSRKQSNT